MDQASLDVSQDVQCLLDFLILVNLFLHKVVILSKWVSLQRNQVLLLHRLR